MAISEARCADADRLARLKGYLELDPDNIELLADTAEAALSLGQSDQAKALIERYARTGQLSPRLINLSGLLALYDRRFDQAATAFAQLNEISFNLEVAFNLAWANAMLKDYEGALANLGENIADALPQAAVLRVQMLHFLGRLDEALMEGERRAQSMTDDPALMGALSIVAMDFGDAALARRYAERAGDHPDALAVLGLFDMEEDRLEAANTRFRAALGAAPGNARVHLGTGLGLLLAREPKSAAKHLDRASELFDTHLGAWVAAGWAHFLAGDMRESRLRFDRAVSLDHSFAEAHGALGVLDISEGEITRASRRAELALRLDRQCLSATLVKIMLLDREGKGDVADRIRQSALHRPLGDSGRTIAKGLIKWNMAAYSDSGRN